MFRKLRRVRDYCKSRFIRWREKTLRYLSDKGVVRLCSTDKRRPVGSYGVKRARNVDCARFSFDCTYSQNDFEITNSMWYETAWGKIRVFTFPVSTHCVTELTFHLNLERFVAHLTPFEYRTLIRRDFYGGRGCIALSTLQTKASFLADLDSFVPTQIRSINFDFKKCDYGYTTQIARLTGFKALTDSELDMIITRIKTSLISSIADLNYRFCSVEHDAEPVYKGHHLAESLICRRCGTPVFKTLRSPETFFCVNCGEIFYPQHICRTPTHDHYLRRYEDTIKYIVDFLEKNH